MQKEELLELHQIFYDIKKYYESINPELTFPKYTALKITPDQVNKSKLEHKYAIFILGEEIASAMKDMDSISSRGVPERMHTLAMHVLKEIEEDNKD